MLQLRVIAPADQIRNLIDRLHALPGFDVVESSGLLPSRTTGALRQYLTLAPTHVERS
jgi:hypothetical protein